MDKKQNKKNKLTRMKTFKVFKKNIHHKDNYTLYIMLYINRFFFNSRLNNQITTNLNLNNLLD